MTLETLVYRATELYDHAKVKARKARAGKKARKGRPARRGLLRVSKSHFYDVIEPKLERVELSPKAVAYTGRSVHKLIGIGEATARILRPRNHVCKCHWHSPTRTQKPIGAAMKLTGTVFLRDAAYRPVTRRGELEERIRQLRMQLWSDPGDRHEIEGLIEQAERELREYNTANMKAETRRD